MIDILDNLIPDRLRIIEESNNPDYILIILSKHYSKTLEELKKMFTINLEVVRKRFDISGGYEDIYELFNYLSSRGVTFESISERTLRIKINVFVNCIY